MKIDLLIEPPRGWYNRSLGAPPTPVKRSLPFVRTEMGAYFHRVRSALVIWHNKPAADPRVWQVPQHIAYRAWCGVSPGSARSRPLLFDQVPEHGKLCATCEARAVGAGWPSSTEMVKPPLMFAPRPLGHWSKQ